MWEIETQTFETRGPASGIHSHEEVEVKIWLANIHWEVYFGSIKDPDVRLPLQLCETDVQQQRHAHGSFWLLATKIES